MAEATTTNDKKGFFAKKKGLKIAGLAVLGVLLLGGVAGALVIQSIKNRPQNVAAKSISNYLFGLKEGGKSKFNMSFEPVAVDGATQSIEFGMDVATTKDLSAARVNLDLNVSAFRVRGMIQTAENGNIYIKLKDLPLLLSSYSQVQAGLTDEQKAQIGSLGDKWIEITPEDVKALGGESLSTENECTKVLSETVMGDEFGELVDGAYMSNRFITSKNSTEEVIDGKKVLKIEVGLDKEVAKKFVDKIAGDNSIKAIAEKCKDELSGVASSTEDSPNELLNGKLTVWADKGKKQLVKLEASGDVFEDGEKTMAVKLAVEPGKGDAAMEVIGDDDKVNIKDLLSAFGLSPEMLQGLVQQGESAL